MSFRSFLTWLFAPTIDWLNKRMIAEKVAERIAPLPEKDPEDFTLTKSSTPWETERCCPRCKGVIESSEWTAKICNDCGFFGESMGDFQDRVRRKIIQGGKWVWQYSYRAGQQEVVDKPYP